MTTVAKLYKSGRFKLLGGDLNTRMPPVLSGLVAYFPFDGTLKPTPLAEFNYDNAPGIASTHPSHPDLFKIASPGQYVTVPGVGTAKYVVVEFDVLIPTTTNSWMVLGLLNDGATNGGLDVFVNGAKIGLNAWDSTTYGANFPVNQRTRVTFFIDPAAPANSKLYFNGIAQTMVGAAPGARNIGDVMVLGGGRVDTPQYTNTEYWGNLRVYTLDVDSVLGYGADLDEDGRGVFIGQPSVNLAYTNGTRDWFPSTLDSTNAPVTITELTNGHYQLATAGTGSTTGFWPVRILFTQSKLVNGETYTLSFKYKFIDGTTFGVNDWCDTPLTRNIKLDMGDYFHVVATGARADYSSVYRFMDFYMGSQTTVEIWDVKLENRYTGSGFSKATSGASGAYLKFQAYLSADHTLVSRSRHTLDNAEKVVAITKSGNTFKVYENGADVTTSRQNKWRIWTYHRPTVNYTMTTAADNIKAIYSWDATDFTNVYRSQSADKAGTYWRTHVYADAAVRLWWRFAADNGGQIRVNGRDTQSLGNWNSNVNPDVYVDLKVGWNVVEIWGMDGDSGGTVSLITQHTGGLNEDLTTSTNKQTVVKLSEHPNVKFMTSEAPLDYLNETDGGGFTHGFQKFLYELSIYNRNLSVGEIEKFTRSMFTMTAGGDVIDDLDEDGENMWPDPDLNSISYGVGGSGLVSIGYDDGKYHQVGPFTSTIWTYKGYDLTDLDVGETYVVTAEVWRSSGSTPTANTIAIEQAPSVAYNGPLWSSIPQAAWTEVEARFTADASVRILFYPTNINPGSGTFRWRNVCVRKLPSKAMSASPTVVKVGEIVES